MIQTRHYKYIISFNLYHSPEEQRVELKNQEIKCLSHEPRATLKLSSRPGSTVTVFLQEKKKDCISRVEEHIEEKLNEYDSFSRENGLQCSIKNITLRHQWSSSKVSLQCYEKHPRNIKGRVLGKADCHIQSVGKSLVHSSKTQKIVNNESVIFLPVRKSCQVVEIVQELYGDPLLP